MNTLMMLTLLFGLGIYIAACFSVGRAWSEQAGAAIGSLMFVMSFFISIAIHADLDFEQQFQGSPDAGFISRGIILGLVLTGMGSIIWIISSMAGNSNYSHQNHNPGASIGKIILQIISLIASILGILAFYLDYLK